MSDPPSTESNPFETARPDRKFGNFPLDQAPGPSYIRSMQRLSPKWVASRVFPALCILLMFPGPFGVGRAQGTSSSGTAGGTARAIYIANIRAGGAVSGATARRIRSLLQLAVLEKYSGSFHVMLETDARLVFRRARPYLGGECSTPACLARMLRALKCSRIIHGDVRREGKQLRLALRSVSVSGENETAVRASVNFAFHEQRMNHFTREAASALVRPGYKMVMNPGPAFEETVEIKSPETATVTNLDTNIFRFTTSNRRIAELVSGWKDDVQEADRECEEGNCRTAINIYRVRILRGIVARIPAREREQIQPFYLEVEKRLAAAYVGYFSKRLARTDREVWGNRISDLKRALNRYRRLEVEIRGVPARYRGGLGPVSRAIAERVKLVPLVVSRTFEKLGDEQYRGFRFFRALELFGKGIIAAGGGARSKSRIAHLRNRIETVQAVRRQYLAGRMNVLLASIPTLKARGETGRIRFLMNRARRLMYTPTGNAAELIAVFNRAARMVNRPTLNLRRITIKSDVEAARVYLGGRIIGVTPLTVTLPDGSYVFRVSRRGYGSRSRSYSIRRDLDATIRLRR